MELDSFQIPSNYKCCSGCGVKFQIEDPEKIGYIDKTVFKEIIDNNRLIARWAEEGTIKVKKGGQNNSNDVLSRYMIEKNRLHELKNKRDKLFIEIDDVDLLQEVENENLSNTNLKNKDFKKKDEGIKKPICLRCHQLKYQSKNLKQQINIQTTENKSEKPDVRTSQEPIDSSPIQDSNQRQNYQIIEEQEEEENSLGEQEDSIFSEGELLKISDINDFLRKLFSKVKRNSTIILVVDSTDLLATLNTQVLEEAFARNHRAIIVLNKVDALPSNCIQLNLLKHIVRQILQNKFGRTLPQLEEILMVSSKNGDGIEKITKYIVQTKQEAKQYNHSRYSKHFYVMGYANTGKSSLINALNKQVRKMKKEDHEKQQQSSDANQLNSQDKKMIRQLLKGGQEAEEQEQEPELTTSQISGTTIGVMKCRNNRLNVNLYDTPGMPNAHQLTSCFHDKSMASILVIDRKISPKAVNLTKDLSLFLGGLCRIDHIRGDNIDLVLFASSNMTVHSTKTFKANELFIKQYNQLLSPVLHPDFASVVFKKHVINLSFNELGKCTYDLHLFGLGWISFTSKSHRKGVCELFVYLPEGVQLELADSFYRVDKNLLSHKVKSRQVHSKLLERQKKSNLLHQSTDKSENVL